MAKKISALEGVFATLQAQKDQILGKQPPERDTAINTVVGDVIIDTVIAFDTKVWETGVQRKGENKWSIVEQYEDENEAANGHAKWVKLLTENPKAELPSIQTWA